MLNKDPLLALMEFIKKDQSSESSASVVKFFCYYPDQIVILSSDHLANLTNICISGQKSFEMGKSREEFRCSIDFSEIQIDTTFNLGPFFVTPVTIVNVFTVEKASFFPMVWIDMRKISSTFSTCLQQTEQYIHLKMPQLLLLMLILHCGKHCMIIFHPAYLLAYVLNMSKQIWFFLPESMMSKLLSV